MLQLYNSFSRRLEPFKPIDPPRVRLYVCGMTVYDYCHVGHARVMVVFDVVARHLRALGYDVTYVRNITDIDDKIIRRAHENYEPYEALTSRFIAAMNEDARALGVLPPDLEPRATAHVGEMIAMIQTLIDKGYAYPSENGDVYYAVAKFPAYGQLANKYLDDLRAGERVEVEAAKRDPLDFVLWKAAKLNEPYWDSPWGPGRPGWHIECSAMACKHLGCHFDIHGGGMDLKFPHHENEIAQSEAANGERFANYWMHNGFVQINKEKMSKSLGNFFTVRQVLKLYDGEVIRAFILASHYRSPLDYSDQHLDAAKASLTRLYTALRGLDLTLPSPITSDSSYQQRFLAAMNDDFNTPEAFAVLFELAREVNRLREERPQEALPLAHELRLLGGRLGLLHQEPEAFLQGGSGADDLAPDAIEALILQRVEARKAKNFAEADRIRDELAAKGVVLEDGPTGTTWRRE